jgi:hypothetical protein
MYGIGGGGGGGGGGDGGGGEVVDTLDHWDVRTHHPHIGHPILTREQLLVIVQNDSDLGPYVVTSRQTPVATIPHIEALSLPLDRKYFHSQGGDIVGFEDTREYSAKQGGLTHFGIADQYDLFGLHGHTLVDWGKGQVGGINFLGVGELRSPMTPPCGGQSPPYPVGNIVSP